MISAQYRRFDQEDAEQQTCRMARMTEVRLTATAIAYTVPHASASQI